MGSAVPYLEKSGIRLSLRTMKPDFAILGSVMALGISPFIMSATESAITIVMNHGLQTYGSDLYVGSMTILQSVLQLILCRSTASQTVCSRSSATILVPVSLTASARRSGA